MRRDIAVTINMINPHLPQLEFINSKAIRKLILAGRRGGKTEGVAYYSVQRFIKPPFEDYKILETAPTADQTDTYWRAVKYSLQDMIDKKLVYQHKGKRLLINELNGAEIRCKTAKTPDNLRSGDADLYISDEHAYTHPDLWRQIVMPMLADRGGEAVFITTPKKKNHTYQMYLKALNNPEWSIHRFTSLDNPYLNKKALKMMMEDMSEEDYRQEILAEFLDAEGAVFTGFSEALYIPKADEYLDHVDHYTVGGIDWGDKVDYTAVSIICVDCQKEIFLDNFNKIGYLAQADRIADICDRTGVDWLLAETNSIGAPMLEQLQNRDLPVTGFQTTATTKPRIIQALNLALQRHDIMFIDEPEATFQLEAYEKKTNPNTNHQTYNAPTGTHDDINIARALAVQASGQPQPDDLFGY